MSKIVNRLELTIVGTKGTGSQRAYIKYNCEDSVMPELQGPPKAIQMSMAEFFVSVASVLSPQQAVGLWYAMMNAAETAEGITLSQPPNVPDWPSGSQITLSALTDDGCHIEWPQALTATAVTGYKVFVDAVEVAQLAGNVLSYDVTGLDPESGHVVKVEATEGGSYTTDGPALPFATTAAP